MSSGSEDFDTRLCAIWTPEDPGAQYIDKAGVERVVAEASNEELIDTVIARAEESVCYEGEAVRPEPGDVSARLVLEYFFYAHPSNLSFPEATIAREALSRMTWQWAKPDSEASDG